MGDSVQPRKYIALGIFAVTVSISASKRASSFTKNISVQYLIPDC